MLHVLNDEVYPDLEHKVIIDESKYLNDKNPLKPIAEKLNSLIKSCNGYGSHVFPVIRKGDMYVTITDAVEELNADFIVLGTHGKVGIQKLIGSYAVKIIDESDIPVVVVQEKAKVSETKTIVFPLKDRRGDRQKVENAVYLAQVTNAKIHIFPHYGYSDNEYIRVDNVMKQICSYFNKYGVEYQIVKTFDRDKDYNEQILSYSELVNADLIMIMSNAKKHHIILGADEESILFNKLNIPVMCHNKRSLNSLRFMGTVGA